MAEHFIYAGIVYVTFIILVFVLACLSEGFDGETIPMSFFIGLILTLVTIGITSMASSGSDWIQNTYIEQPEEHHSENKPRRPNKINHAKTSPV